jgi:hypothetical protein
MDAPMAKGSKMYWIISSLDRGVGGISGKGICVGCGVCAGCTDIVEVAGLVGRDWAWIGKFGHVKFDTKNK